MTLRPRPAFPPTHVVEALRQYPVPTWWRARLALAERVAWLVGRCDARVPQQLPIRREVAEMAAIVSVVEEREGLELIKRIAREGCHQRIDGDLVLISARELDALAAEAGYRDDEKYRLDADELAEIAALERARAVDEQRRAPPSAARPASEASATTEGP